MNDIEILLEDFIKGKIEPDKLENYKGAYKMGFFYTKDLQKAIENLIKENKEWKKYATEEVEEEITELNNKNCELEFKIEHLIQENKELKEETAENQDYIKDLQKKLTNAIEIKYIHQDYIPKSKIKELREIDNIDLLQTKLKQLLEEGE